MCGFGANMRGISSSPCQTVPSFAPLDGPRLLFKDRVHSLRDRANDADGDWSKWTGSDEENEFDGRACRATTRVDAATVTDRNGRPGWRDRVWAVVLTAVLLSGGLAFAVNPPTAGADPPGTSTFTSVGSSTYTVPTGVTALTVVAIGGGGGGGDSSPAEPVKPFETSDQLFFCASLVMVGLLIHAMVGILGGDGWRLQNRRGLAA
jgi:hypothetical protein